MCLNFFDFEAPRGHIVVAVVFSPAFTVYDNFNKSQKYKRTVTFKNSIFWIVENTRFHQNSWNWNHVCWRFVRHPEDLGAKCFDRSARYCCQASFLGIAETAWLSSDVFICSSCGFNWFFEVTAWKLLSKTFGFRYDTLQWQRTVSGVTYSYLKINRWWPI